MKQPFQIGDLVQCSFLPTGSPPYAALVARTVTHIEPIGDGYANGKVTSTGWLVSADGGRPCMHCGATVPSVPLIDSGYYTHVVST